MTHRSGLSLSIIIWRIGGGEPSFLEPWGPTILLAALGVMVSMLATSAVDCGFEPRSCQTKDFKIGICCFSAKHAALRRKSKDCLLGIRILCPERSDMSTCGLLFQ